MEMWWFHSNAWERCPYTFHLQRLHDQQLYFWMYGPYPVKYNPIGCSSNYLLHMANQSQMYHWRLDSKYFSLHESFFWQFFFHCEIATISHMDLEKKQRILIKTILIWYLNLNVVNTCESSDVHVRKIFGFEDFDTEFLFGWYIT